MINFILILLILCVIGYFVYRYYLSLSNERDDDIFKDDFKDVKTLTEKISREFSMMLKQDIREKNMTKAEYEQKNRSKAALRASLKEAAYGNGKAKKTIKLYIKNMLIDPSMHYGIDENTIDEIIPFAKTNELKSQDKFEILLYIYYNNKLDEDGKPLKQDGFKQMMKDYNLFEPETVNGEKVYDFSKNRLDYVFEKVMETERLTYNDKLEILSQRIFENYKGFGAIDILFDTGCDEIDAGVSGIPKDGYDISNNAKDLKFRYQSIWVMISGVNMHLSCISFGSQEELIRVVQNIYKYGANKVLSKKQGYVISTMKNGSRITVVRPPFAESYALFARKFDSAKSIAPESLIVGENAIIPLTLIKWLIKGQRNIGITGAMGTGKSTMLKSLIRYIDPTFTLRIQEISAELNLSYAYPDRNIVSFQETESIKSQEGLNLQKKTNGSVNIIGEVAEAIQANFVVQTAMVASLFAMFTHHAKTSYDYVMAIANNLLDPVVGIYREKKEAVEMAAKILHIDMHLENRKGDRYVERITEIIPTKEMDYPSDNDAKASAHDDEKEFYKRLTDRRMFIERNLVEFHDGEFVLMNLPSEEMQKEIKLKLTTEEEKEFDNDMLLLKTLPSRYKQQYRNKIVS